MARFFHLAHEMANGLLLRHLEIEICLHATTVHMCRHRVPHRARGQFGHSHLQLTSWQHLIDQHLVDVAFVAHLQTTHVGHHGIFLGHFLARIFLMGSGAVEIELSRFRRIFALKEHVAVATTDVEGFLITECKRFIAYPDNALTTYVEDTHLAARGEEGGTQGVDGLEFQRLFHRHGTAHHHAVIH